MKLRDVPNRMVEAGFKLDCNDGLGKRYVRYRFDDARLQPVRVRVRSTSS